MMQGLQAWAGAVYEGVPTLLHACSPHRSLLTNPPHLSCSPRPQDIRLADRGLVWNTDLIEAVELENLLANAAITMHSAERRK